MKLFTCVAVTLLLSVSLAQATESCEEIAIKSVIGTVDAEKNALKMMKDEDNGFKGLFGKIIKSAKIKDVSDTDTLIAGQKAARQLKALASCLLEDWPRLTSDAVGITHSSGKLESRTAMSQFQDDFRDGLNILIAAIGDENVGVIAEFQKLIDERPEDLKTLKRAMAQNIVRPLGAAKKAAHKNVKDIE